MNYSQQPKPHKAGHKHRGKRRSYFSQKGFQDRESCEADAGGSQRGATAVERYGLNHGAEQDTTAAGRKLNKFGSRETHRGKQF